MKRDIETREDIFLLVKSFYEKLLADPSINYFFIDIAKIDIEDHLQVLVDFWEMVLFHSDAYQKNAMEPHMALHRKSPFKPHHFITWLPYFFETLDELFEGATAELAKQRASSIASVMQTNVLRLNK
jgi:hemoglobin